MTVFTATVTAKSVPAEAAGVHLTGTLYATDTARRVNFGKAFALVVNDAALWTNVEPLIGQRIVMSIRTV